MADKIRDRPQSLADPAPLRLRDMGDGTWAEVVAVDGIVVDATDLEIGAVEIKDGSSDARAAVGPGTSANGVRVVTASDDPLLVANHTDLAAILAKLTSDPATQTTLAAILAKLTSDPATQTTLAAILAKLIAAPATEAKQDTIVSVIGSPFQAGGSIGNTTFAATQSGTWNVGITGAVTVAGTFWQTTQPVSAASLPLPSGAATSAKQDSVITQVSPIQGAAAITPHDTNTVTAGRQLFISCTVAGNVKVKFTDGSTLTFPVNVGTTVLSWAVIQVFITGTTATGTYTNLV